MAGPRRTQPRDKMAIPETTSIGRAFAERRIALRLTHQTLAGLAGVSRSGVQSLERGSGSVKFGYVVVVAEVLGMYLDARTTAE